MDGLVEGEQVKPENVRRRLTFEELISDASRVMGVKAVFGRLSSRVMCFGGRGTPDQSGRYYQAARSAAERSVGGQPFLLTIGGGDNVPESLRRRVLDVAVVSGVYGKTEAFVDDPAERARLSQWPTAVALHDIWEFEEPPHVINDLGAPDGRILENAFDSVIRPEERLEKLVAALRERVLVLKDVAPLPNFHDDGRVVPAMDRLPRRVSAEEGKRIAAVVQRLERDRAVVTEVKERNRAAYSGRVTCEGCGFADEDAGLLDAHHLVPLSVEARTSTPSDFAVLCPTCHRIVHHKDRSRMKPLPVPDLRAWWEARLPPR